jgi:microcystin-dependent protein
VWAQKGDQGVDGVPGSLATPAGTISLWASDVAPANWMICDGSAISRTQYASLFAAIGTSYGAGDGVNTFNLPNLKGQTPIGKDAAQTEFAALNQKGGEKKHLLTAAEMPSHTHTQNSHRHDVAQDNGVQLVLVDSNAPDATGANRFRLAVGTGSMGLDTNDITATNQNTGGGATHNVLQPYTVVNFIIKVTNGDTPDDSQLTQRVSNLEEFSSAAPAGTITIFGGDTAPTNWLFCDGAAVSRALYASLFAAIGTKYGAGDGSTTFNLPNLKGRVPVGRDAAQTEFDILGETGGTKTHQHQHLSPIGVASTNMYVLNPTNAQMDWSGSAYDLNGVITAAFGGGGLAPTSGAMEMYRVTSTPSGTLPPYTVVNFVIKVTNGDTQGDSQLTQRVGAIEVAAAVATVTITSLVTNFAAANGAADYPYIYKKNGWATISGQLKQTAGFTGGIAFTIPVGFRPAFWQRGLRASTVNGGNVVGPELRIDIGADGIFSIGKLNTSATPAWDATTWIFWTFTYPVA